MMAFSEHFARVAAIAGASDAVPLEHLYLEGTTQTCLLSGAEAAEDSARESSKSGVDRDSGNIVA